MGISLPNLRFLYKLVVLSLQTFGLGCCSELGRANWERRGEFMMVSSMMSALFAFFSGGSVFRNKFLSILKNLPGEFSKSYRTNQSQVYAVFSIHCKDIYVGETERALLTRWQEEYNSALMASKSGFGTHFQKVMGHGSHAHLANSL